MNLSFLISLMTGEAADMAARARRSVVNYLLAAIAGLFGLVFLLVAAFIFVADNLRHGALNTALIFAGVFVAFAVIAVAVNRFRSARLARRVRERRQGDLKIALGSTLIAALPALLARRGGLAGLALPAVAALAFAIYHENTRKKPGPDAD